MVQVKLAWCLSRKREKQRDPQTVLSVTGIVGVTLLKGYRWNLSRLRDAVPFVPVLCFALPKLFSYETADNS